MQDIKLVSSVTELRLTEMIHTAVYKSKVFLSYIKRRDMKAYNREPDDWTKRFYIFPLTLLYIYIEYFYSSLACVHHRDLLTVYIYWVWIWVKTRIHYLNSGRACEEHRTEDKVLFGNSNFVTNHELKHLKILRCLILQYRPWLLR
jgi:hypothetical protein